MNCLRIVGFGVKTSQLTQEAISHFSYSKKILWLGTMPGFAEMVAKHHWNAENITYLYNNGDLDTSNYRKIKEKVLAELNNHHDIALVVLGHPRLGVTIVQEFEAERTKQQFDLIVTPGISSFDTMINDLAIDPIEEGTCLLDANRLLLYDYQMDPCLNYFVYHICSVGNSNTDYEDPAQRNGLIFLKEKLLKHFLPTHLITLISSSASDNYLPLFIKKSISVLEDLLPHITYASSLFIPGALPLSSQVNRKFLSFITKNTDYAQ